MQVTITPGKMNGSITAPASKSMMQRVCAAALLHRGETIIHRPGFSCDDKAALGIIKQLGAIVTEQTESAVTIYSKGVNPVSAFINCGESGLAARLFTPIAALCDSPIKIEGTGSLLGRPMHLFNDILPALDVSLTDFSGYIPFTVNGPLQPKSISLDGSLSSQFLSGILFAFCYCATEPVTITVDNLESKPYIDLTLDVLARFGKRVQHDDYKIFYIDPVLFQTPDTVEITIEGDWSSAAFFLVGGAIAGNVTVSHLDAESKQADKGLLQLLTDIGAYITVKDDSVNVMQNVLQPFEFDATGCPDLFPILAVLGARCKGESCIYGVHRLFDKESNRVESISEMLLQFGIFHSFGDDMLCVQGTERFRFATIESYNDHRIVMAAAIASLHAKGPVIINDQGAVNKSYPGFFKHLTLCGINCLY